MSSSSPQATEYRRLLRQRGELGQWDRWRMHMAELKGLPAPEPPLPKLSRSQLRRFWLDKFSMAEIVEMGGALTSLTREETA